jgi:hypothetical protein
LIDAGGSWGPLSRFLVRIPFSFCVFLRHRFPVIGAVAASIAAAVAASEQVLACKRAVHIEEGQIGADWIGEERFDAG